MAFGGPQTANSLFRLADVLRGNAQDKTRHTERMYDIRFRGEEAAARAKNRELQNQVTLQKMQREEYLSQPTTLGEAIKSMKIPDEIKQQHLSSIPPNKLNMLTTRRQVIDAYRSAVAPTPKEPDYTLGPGQTRFSGTSNEVIARGAEKPEPEAGKYTKSQQINDAQQYYKELISDVKTRYGNGDLTDTDYQKKHDKIMMDMRDDIRLIKRGKEPSYLKEQIEPDVIEQTRQPRAIKRTGFHNGRKVIQYEDGSIEYAPDTHRRDAKH